MNIKTKIINQIIAREGGYVNNKDDSGGETMYCITKATAYNHGYKGKMIELSHSQAFSIYSSTFWDAQHLNDVEKISKIIVEEIADTGVNMGTRVAVIFLQPEQNIKNETFLFGWFSQRIINPLKRIFNAN